MLARVLFYPPGCAPCAMARAAGRGEASLYKSNRINPDRTTQT